MATKSEIRHRTAGQNIGEKETLTTSNVEKRTDKDKYVNSLYGSSHVIVIFVLVAAISCVVYKSCTFLPKSKPIDALVTEFSGDRARKHLEAIASIGPRPSGSYANDIITVEYILNKLNSIKQQANLQYHIEIELQTASGSFAFVRKSEFIELGFTSAYGNITNILAKISPKKSTNVFVLANAHYDTVMNTEGASDDTVSCAVLIEIFRAISKSEAKYLKHGVIFLFNGAEEGGLSGSHAFVQHRWLSVVKAVINLEAAGSGGREFVFQTGPEHPWILNTYASSAKYPYASVVAQEIFQSGVIPSDTDFRVFVKYGKLVGIDIAFVNNGYVYHTRNDDAKSIPSGSIQRAGDNIHGLIKAMANSEYLENPGIYKHGNSVFFDILGLFVVYYPKRLHIFMNNITCFVVILHIIRYLFRRKTLVTEHVGSRYLANSTVTIASLLLATFTILISWVLAFAVPIGVALALIKLNAVMTWYTYPKFAILLYGIPSLFGMLLTHFIGNKLMKKVSYPNILSFIYGHLLIHSSILFYLNQKGILSSFLLWIWVIFPFVFLCLIYEQCKTKAQVIYSLVIIAYTPPALVTMYHLDILFSFFGALLGRAGTELQSDVVIAGLSALSIVVMFTYFMCLYHNAANMRTFLFVIGLLGILPFLYVLTGNLHPYSARNPTTPKRLFMQHTWRTFHSSNGTIKRQDSGIWIQPMDAIGFKSVENIDFFKKTEKFQCDGSYCGLPYYYPMRMVVREQWYLRGEKPDVKINPLSTDIFQRVEKPGGAIRFYFDIRGPDHMVLFLTLKPGVKLDWSMYKSENGHIYTMDDYVGDYAHIVFYSHGYYSESWKFWMEFEKSSSSPVLAELGIARHYLHGNNSRTTFLNAAIKSLPDWICDNAWTSNYDSFTLE